MFARRTEAGFYNLSTTADAFHRLPRITFSLTEGFSLMSNRTLDIYRADYINSLLVIFLFPLIAFLFFLVLYSKQLSQIKSRQLSHELVKVKRAGRKEFVRCFIKFALFAVLVTTIGMIITTTSYLAVAMFRHEDTTAASIERTHRMKLAYELFDRTFDEQRDFPYLPGSLLEASRVARSQLRDFFEIFYTERHYQMLLKFKSLMRARNRIVLALNLTSGVLLGLFAIACFLMLLLSRGLRLEPQKLAILGLVVLVGLTTTFAVDLTSTVIISDFCVDAQPAIYDVVQHRVYGNNPITKEGVEHYLYCDVATWEERETLVATTIESVANGTLSWMLGFWFDVSAAKVKANELIRIVSCRRMHRSLTMALEQLCVAPLDLTAGLVFFQAGGIVLLLLFLVFVRFI